MQVTCCFCLQSYNFPYNLARYTTNRFNFHSWHLNIMLVPLLLLLLFLSGTLDRCVNGEYFSLFHRCSSTLQVWLCNGNRMYFPSQCLSIWTSFNSNQAFQYVPIFLLFEYLHYCFVDHIQLKEAHLAITRRFGCDLVHVPARLSGTQRLYSLIIWILQ